MSAKQTVKIVLLVLLAMTFVWSFIVVFDNDGVPSVPSIKEHSRIQTFLQHATDIKRIYNNIDVDSCVFTYRTALSGSAQFWDAVNDAAYAEGWSLVADKDDIRVYEKLTGTGQGRWWGGEQASVAFISETQTVVVAWVQGDATEKIERFSDLREAGWALRVIQPKFDESVRTKRAESPLPPGPFHGLWEAEGNTAYIITDLTGQPVSVSSPKNDTWDVEFKNVTRKAGQLRFDQYHYTKPEPRLKTITNPTGDHPFSGVRCEVILRIHSGDPDLIEMSMKTVHAPQPITGQLRRKSSSKKMTTTQLGS